MVMMPTMNALRNRAITACVLAAGVVMGCAPALNWREVRPDEADGLVAWFPCKPDRAERVMAWPGVPKAVVHLLSCRTGGALWALRYTTVPDVPQVNTTLTEWARAFKAVPGTVVHEVGPVQVRGMTPNAEAQAWEITLPDAGRSAAFAEKHIKAWHFSHGLTVFQASVWQPTPFESRQEGEDVAQSFQNGLHFPD